MDTCTAQMRRKGVVVIPAGLRKELGMDEGSLLLIERREGGLFIRPAVAVAVEEYSKERLASFLLGDAFDEASYARARARVVELGLDPDAIPHERPDEQAGSGVPGRERADGSGD